MSSVEVMASGDATSPVEDAVSTPPPHRGAVRRQLGSELRLVFGRRRNLALLAVLAVTSVLIGVAVKTSSPGPGEGPPFISEISNNGLFLVFTALTVSLPLFLPLAIAVVAGDSIAGEASGGTLRYLLTVPVARGRVLAVKAAAVLVYTAATVLVVAVVGFVTGWTLFGLREVTLLSGDTVSLGSGLLRTAGVAAYVIVALTGLLAIGMFVSTLTEVALGAMAATVGIAIVANVLDAVPQLGALRGLLFPHHWLGFGELLRTAPDVGALLRWSSLQLGYIVLFGALAWARLGTRDVTS